MKRRIFFILTALVLLFAVGLVVLREREYQRESYQGRHTRDWAWMMLSSQASPSDTNRQEAIAALRALGPRAVPPLRRMLAERDKIYEKPIVQAARSLPVSQRLALIRKLRPGQALAHRLAAINALGILGTNAAEAVPDLLQAMQEPIGQIRWDAARALAAIGDAGVAALAAAAADTNAGVRHAAIFALGESRTNAPFVAAALFDGLLDPDQSVRASASYAVGKLRLNAVPMLMEQLSSKDLGIQVAAVRALAGVNPPPRLISTNLINIASTSNRELRRQTIETMGVLRVSTSNAVSIFMTALDDPDPAIRLTAIKAVGEISWKTAGAIPRLVQFTRSDVTGEREAATSALAQFGLRASDAAPAIVLLLNDAEPKVRAAATNALGRINPLSN